MRGLFVCPISADLPGNRGILNKMEYQRAALAELAGTVDVVISRVLYYVALRRLKMSLHTIILTQRRHHGPGATASQ